jgi:hypothetical protein
MARECALTALQRVPEEGRKRLLEDLATAAYSFAVDKFGTGEVERAQSQADAESWRSFLLVGVLGFGAIEIAPWLGRKHIELQKSVGRVRRALGH